MEKLMGFLGTTGTWLCLAWSKIAPWLQVKGWHLDHQVPPCTGFPWAGPVYWSAHYPPTCPSNVPGGGPPQGLPFLPPEHPALVIRWCACFLVSTAGPAARRGSSALLARRHLRPLAGFCFLDSVSACLMMYPYALLLSFCLLLLPGAWPWSHCVPSLWDTLWNEWMDSREWTSERMGVQPSTRCREGSVGQSISLRGI